MSKIYILGSIAYSNPFKELGTCLIGRHLLTDVDALVFTGGHDINPKLYSEEVHDSTGTPNNQRDKEEVSLFTEAVRMGIPMVGICRGAQLLNVLNGGKLFQHVDGHTTSHEIKTKDGTTVYVNSTHHQMMILNDKVPHELLAWSEGVAKIYEQGPNATKPKMKLTASGKVVEPEAVWYPRTKCLCVQWHPEGLMNTTPPGQFFQKLVKEFIL